MKRSSRGVTLVELMITVAVLGISVGGAMAATHRLRLSGISELQRERALLALEYHADCIVQQRPPDPDIAGPLLKAIPDAALASSHQGRLVHLDLSWRDPSGAPSTRRLTVFGGQR